MNNKKITASTIHSYQTAKRALRWLAYALFSVVLNTPAQAQQASFSNGILTLPAVITDTSAVTMQLELTNRTPIEFRAISSTATTVTDTALVALLDAATLSIPLVRVGGIDYAAELTVTGNNPLTLRLASLSVYTHPVIVPQGVAALPNGRGGVNYEPVKIAASSGFDNERSQAAFAQTLYPFLRRSTCIACHNSGMPGGTGAQAPLHTDNDVALAHDYALTRVNFADPANSKFVVRMGLDRHNCPASDCAQAAQDMLQAILAWRAQIADMLQDTPRTVAANVLVSQTEIEQWIAADKAQLAVADRHFIVYTSMHELHNEGLTADELNIVRAGLSKALNSVARWAPEIVNPVDVNGKGLLYKFDIRNYWGWNKGVTRLLFGGSDDDLAFGRNKRDFRGTLVSGSNVQRERYNYTSEATWVPEFSLKIWERVLHGNVEGAVSNGTIPPYIDGFRGTRSSNAAGAYIALDDFEWVETAQLIYTLTRPDVYNAIMMIPMTSVELEDELGVDKSLGMDSYDYVVSYDAITIDSRLLWRAQRKDGGWYWKTWDIFTGQLARERSIHEIYREAGADIRFPWWANPVPVFVDPLVNRRDTTTWSFVASLAQPFTTNPSQIPAGCDPLPNFSGIAGFYNCKHFTGTGGLQQSASEIIWDLPNGLQGYMLTGAFNQRRVDAFVNIVRDPRVVPNATDNIATQTGFAFGKIVNGQQRTGGFNDPRLNVGSSCIGCHIDGMNRINNDMRDWLDENPERLPKGPYGVDGWINDPAKVARVRELYPPSSVIRAYNEEARKTFLGSMAEIKHAMIVGPDKNVFVEPVIWTVEYVQRKKYRYPQTTSN